MGLTNLFGFSGSKKEPFLNLLGMPIVKKPTQFNQVILIIESNLVICDFPDVIDFLMLVKYTNWLIIFSSEYIVSSYGNNFRDMSFLTETIQFNSIQFNSIQFNSIQFNSIQFNSVQFNSVQFNSISFVSHIFESFLMN